MQSNLSTRDKGDRDVMDKGAIVAKGKHDSLIQEGGLYEEIYNLQLKPQNDVMLDISKDDLSDTKVRI